jgi:hypothetical protein
MIRINCTNCKAQLSIDEAFAGGVCRCQYCGTIQTVPKHLSGAAAAEAPIKAAAGSPKELYRKKSRGDIGMSSGLDAIAEIVASSGLSGSGLTSGYPRRRSLAGGAESTAAPTPAAAPAKNKQLLLILGGAGVLIVLLIGVLIGLVMRGGNASGSTGGIPSDATGNPSNPSVVSPNIHNTANPTVLTPADAKGPLFLHLQLNDPSVVFVLDRGQVTQPYFNYVKMACLNAIDSFRPDQKFQVICWSDQNKEPEMFPRSLTAAGNSAEVKRCAEGLENVFAFGATEPRPALDRAFASNPAAVVVATGKPMDESFVQAVMDARKNKPTKVYCLSLTESASTKAMRDIAAKTGGTYRLVSLDELQSVSR